MSKILFKESLSKYKNKNIDLPRHNWYYFKESFSATLVDEAINESKINKKDLIIDPFNGSGTVTLAAATKGYNAVGFEINPFLAFLGKTKLAKPSVKNFDQLRKKIIKESNKNCISPLENFSTFSESKKNRKWLFNINVLRAFEIGWLSTCDEKNEDNKNLMRLALIGAAMDNCNAKKDGKCLRYKPDWENLNYSKNSFLRSLEKRLVLIREDILNNPLSKNAIIIKGDSRTLLNKRLKRKFSLCLTSPPYLNSFDYTDVYRPELFLGKFINTKEELFKLRFKTVRSHVVLKRKKSEINLRCTILNDIFEELKSNNESLWNPSLPYMIQGYFEDIQNILKCLKEFAEIKAKLWIVVSTSSYIGIEIPVDLIIANIGSQLGWKLECIQIQRYLRNYSPKNKSNSNNSGNKLRESLIKFEN